MIPKSASQIANEFRRNKQTPGGEPAAATVSRALIHPVSNEVQFFVGPTGDLLDRNGNAVVAANDSVIMVPGPGVEVLESALDRATAGQLIVVQPGGYTASRLLKHDVDWLFMPGATVTEDAGFADEGDGIFADLNAAKTCKILGWGQFNATAGRGVCVRLQHASSNVYIEGMGITATGATVNSAFQLNGGTVFARIARKIEAGYDAIWCESGSPVITVYADSIETVADGSNCLETAGTPTVFLEARRLSSVSENALEIGGGTVRIRADQIVSEIVNNLSGTASLMVTGAHFTMTGAGAAVWHIQNSNLGLYQCRLIAGASATNSITADAARNSRIFGCLTNKDPHVDVTNLITNGLLTDPDAT